MRNTERPNIIMKLIKVAFIALAFFSQITVYASHAPYVESFTTKLSSEYGSEYTYEEVASVVEEVSKKYNVSFERMMYTIEGESHFKNVQSNCHKNTITNCGNTGEREQSFGLGQFNINTLSKENALNPYIAIEEMAKLFSKGEQCRWTEYKLKYGCN